ncbi:hypothetical protein MMC25_004965 [Agyrium rufum]|nr:hypothetical protein [Agyrium rufum]
MPDSNNRSQPRAGLRTNQETSNSSVRDDVHGTVGNKNSETNDEDVWDEEDSTSGNSSLPTLARNAKNGNASEDRNEPSGLIPSMETDDTTNSSLPSESIASVDPRTIPQPEHLRSVPGLHDTGHHDVGMTRAIEVRPPTITHVLQGPGQMNQRSSTSQAGSKTQLDFNAELFGPKANTDPRDYDFHNRPVSSDHFQEYARKVKDELDRLRRDTTNNATEHVYQTKRADFWETFARSLAQKLPDSHIADVSLPAELPAYVDFAKRNTVDEPVAPEDPPADKPFDPNAIDHAFALESLPFLYKDNEFDQMNQRACELALSRAVVMRTLERPRAMLRRVEEAILFAEKLHYAPLVSRCNYYKAVAMYDAGQYDGALNLFYRALTIKGKYKEGMYIDQWVEHAEEKNVDYHNDSFRTAFDRIRAEGLDGGSTKAGSENASRASRDPLRELKRGGASVESGEFDDDGKGFDEVGGEGVWEDDDGDDGDDGGDGGGSYSEGNGSK